MLARTECRLQQFVWSDGVRREDRCVFGTKSLVDFFERVSTFVLAVAKCRIDEYDSAHPYDENRRKWSSARRQAGLSGECVFADIYIDDYACVRPDEDILRKGSRPQEHLAIARQTFQEAAWQIAVEVQLGWAGVDHLHAGRRVHVCARNQKARDAGGHREPQLRAAEEGRRVSREEVERLVGRTSHVAQVAAEGNAYLKPIL
ncbi:MAG: hypothetical protein SGPRY_010803, partial [Prymnesium sp.]